MQAFKHNTTQKTIPNFVTFSLQISYVKIRKLKELKNSLIAGKTDTQLAKSLFKHQKMVKQLQHQ